MDSVFFVKQKTAYEMRRSLVGSEMCIRDRENGAPKMDQFIGSIMKIPMHDIAVFYPVVI